MEILFQTQLLSPIYNLLKTLIFLVSECSSPLCVAKMQLSFSSVAISQIDLDSITVPSLVVRKMKIIM